MKKNDINNTSESVDPNKWKDNLRRGDSKKDSSLSPMKSVSLSPMKSISLSPKKSVKDKD